VLICTAITADTGISTQSGEVVAGQNCRVRDESRDTIRRSAGHEVQSCFLRRLSHKPVHNLAHQLVGGITLVSTAQWDALIGTEAPSEAMLGRLLPPSLGQ
jgi:hypothetical protein